MKLGDMKETIMKSEIFLKSQMLSAFDLGLVLNDLVWLLQSDLENPFMASVVGLSGQNFSRRGESITSTAPWVAAPLSVASATAIAQASIVVTVSGVGVLIWIGYSRQDPECECQHVSRDACIPWSEHVMNHVYTFLCQFLITYLTQLIHSLSPDTGRGSHTH